MRPCALQAEEVGVWCGVGLRRETREGAPPPPWPAPEAAPPAAPGRQEAACWPEARDATPSAEGPEADSERAGPPLASGGRPPLRGGLGAAHLDPLGSVPDRLRRSGTLMPAKQAEDEDEVRGKVAVGGRRPPRGGGLRSRRGERRSRESRTPSPLDHAPLYGLVYGRAQRHA